ncbi:MAG: surface lipoprotein assembly modifier [Burkholderiales bacterium]
MLQQALQQRVDGDLDKAVLGLRRIIAERPGDHRARYELALTYNLQLNFTAASATARELMDDPSTPDYLKAFVYEFMLDLTAADRRHLVVPSLNVGLIYDDNVNVGPSRQSFAAGGATLVLDPGAAPKRDWGLATSASVMHRYLSPTAVDVFGRSTVFMWQSLASISRVDYFKEHAFSQNVTTLQTGPALAAAGRWRAQVNLRYDDIRIGGDRLGGFAALNPGATWQLGLATELSADVEAQQRRYEGANTPRNSEFDSAGASVVHRFGADKAFSILGALRGFDERADTARFSNKGSDLLARLTWNAWQGGALTLTATDTRAKYGDVEPLFNVRRDERENRVAVGVQHAFGEGALRYWQLNGVLSYTKRRSNVDIYAYERSSAALTLSRNF